MIQKEKDSLSSLLKELKDRFQGLSRQIHWTVADSEVLDDIANSKEQRKDISNRVTRVFGSKLLAANIFPLFLAYKAWHRTKAVYSFNREFVDAMAQTEDTTILLALLERLPFKDMLFFFPEGVLPKIAGEETAGLFVHIEKHPGCIWVFFNYIDRNLDNGAKYYPGIAFSFPITNEMKISQVFETAQYREWVSTYKLTVAIDRQLNDEQAEERMSAERRVLNLAINLMYYLSSDKPDIKPIRSRRKPHRTSSSTKAPSDPAINLNEVGTKYAEIVYRHYSGNHAPAETEDKEDEESAEGTEIQTTKQAKKRRPHARRAHWQQYWTGKGREIPVLHWIPDLFVGANRDDQAIVVYDVAKKPLKGKKNPNTSKKKRNK